MHGTHGDIMAASPLPCRWRCAPAPEGPDPQAKSTDADWRVAQASAAALSQGMGIRRRNIGIHEVSVVNRSVVRIFDCICNVQEAVEEEEGHVDHA